MTGPTYRAAARFFFEVPPRPPMAHVPPFVDMAHRTTKPDPLALPRAVAVLLAGLVVLCAVLWWLS